MKVNFFTVAGVAGNQRQIAEAVMKTVFKGWDPAEVNIERRVITDIKQVGDIRGAGCIILAGTGGTSSKIIHIVEASRKPCLILAHSKYNSLPSVLEALGVLKTKKIPVQVLYEDFSWKRIKQFIRVAEAVSRIGQSRLACIGNIPHKPKDTLGVQLIPLTLQELVSRIKKTEPDAEARITQHLKNIFARVKVSDEAIAGSVRVYLAMKALAADRKIDALTIRCFDLLPYEVTSCIGMALSNDAGLVAGCEGDIDAAITMMLTRYLTGKPSFIANPVAVDSRKNILTLAHCTIATQMIQAKRSGLLPHFESGKGVAIDGYIKQGKATLVRVNLDLGKMAIIPGKVIKSRMGYPDLCRTQVIVKIPHAGRFIEKAVGNHHILVLGDHAQEFRQLARFLGLEPVAL